MPILHITFFAAWMVIWSTIGYLANVSSYSWYVYFAVMGAFLAWFTYTFLPSNHRR